MVAERPLQLIFGGVLVVYVPGNVLAHLGTKRDELINMLGSYILFTHMIAQRRKVMRGKAVDKRS